MLVVAGKTTRAGEVALSKVSPADASRLLRGMGRLVFAMVALCFMASGCWLVCYPGGRRAAPSNAVTVFVVRHAEKADPNDQDTPLSEEGHARAEVLAQQLPIKTIEAIYATEKKRTQQTVAPTAVRCGLTPIVIPIAEEARLLAAVRAATPGRAVLVAGHSHTVPGIVTALSGEAVPPIPENEFNNLYVITLRADGSRQLQRMTYGAPPR